MANFRPLTRYLCYCLDQLIDRYGLAAPFLDMGCGAGEFSRHLARRGWQGTAIDYSEDAQERARQNLQALPRITLEQRSLFDVTGRYQTVLILDVLEHVENDQAVLNKVTAVLQPGGFAVIGVPYNPPEWRWDDDFYGHVRRYTQAELREKLAAAGLVPIVFWDISFPVFWLLRRLYTRLKASPAHLPDDAETRTKLSTVQSAWDIPVVAPLLEMLQFLWWPLYWLQFALFRQQLRHGHALLVLARKPDQPTV
jgi:SAM-dependent methyltransferase